MKCLFELIGQKDTTYFIKDLDGPVSVTNDAESVLDAFSKQGIDTVVYCGTDGEWTKMYYGEINNWTHQGRGVVFEAWSEQ